MKYCPSSKEEEQFLQSYDSSKYQKPAVAADTALFAISGDKLAILLIERGGFPYKGCWALPGGFVDIDEDIFASAKRELLEETGIEDVYIEQSFTWGKVGRDPRSRVITVSHIALTDIQSVKAGDDAKKAEWFCIEDYLKTHEGKTTAVSYSLNGSKNISVEVEYPKGRIQEISCKKSGGLAFDHAQSIAYSIELLKKRAKEMAALSLDDGGRARAINIIENV